MRAMIRKVSLWAGVSLAVVCHGQELNLNPPDLSPLKRIGKAAGDPIPFIVEGRCALPIVIGVKPAERVAWAAEFLAESIGEMTGHTPDVVKQDGVDGPAVYIGVPDALQKAGLSADGMQPGGFAVVTRGGSLYLYGNDGKPSTGSAYAALDFGERVLGIRKYFEPELGGRSVVKTQTLPFKTPAEVAAEVRHCIDLLGAGGGYICGPDIISSRMCRRRMWSHCSIRRANTAPPPTPALKPWKTTDDFSKLATRASTSWKDNHMTRERLSLDRNWKFHLQEQPLQTDGICRLKAGDWTTTDKWKPDENEQIETSLMYTGPALIHYDDRRWRTLDIPHDWAVEQTATSEAPMTQGYLPMGIGWYRRALDIPAEAAGRRILLEFEGVFRECNIMLNGNLVGQNRSGHMGFTCDISAVAEPGKSNVLTVRVDATRKEGWFYEGSGIYLNGMRIKLKGSCNHDSHAGVGRAIPQRLHEYRVRLLKEMGVNAYRCSHYPVSPELMDIFDREGLLVICETRATGANAEALSQLERHVRRDRNHPAVILWSIANEEMVIQGNPVGARIATVMQSVIKRLDPTRPTTAAMNRPVFDGFTEVIDVMGINYWHVDLFRVKYQDKPCYYSETATTRSTRGIYHWDRDRCFVPLENREAPAGALDLVDDHYWSLGNRDDVAGIFIWTGFDYRGEPTPFKHWPCVGSHSGAMDSCGFPKDYFYYYQAVWADQPVLHIATHWNRREQDGQTVSVPCFSNAAEVELFLNGRSLGRKNIRGAHAVWLVPYDAGHLEALGYRDGKAVVSAVVDTTGGASAIRLTAVHSSLQADGADIDSPPFMALFALMAELDRPLLLHPTLGMEAPDYAGEPHSKYELWWTLGWPYETSKAMYRLVFAGVFDRWSELKIITHHGGGLIPMVEGRLGAGLKAYGTRTPPELREVENTPLRGEPLAAFKRFYTDSATGHPGWDAACAGALEKGIAVSVWPGVERACGVRGHAQDGAWSVPSQTWTAG